jgi:hypothetical protein
MKRYKIKVDPSLNVRNTAFGIRIGEDDVFIPAGLANALKQVPLGDDAMTVANFLAAFPTSVAGSLGVSAEAVLKAADAFVELLLHTSGSDMSLPRRPMPRLARGAKHPGQIDQVRDPSSDGSSTVFVEPAS